MVPSVVAALPESFTLYVFLGLAIVFQTEAIHHWQQAGKTDFEEPRHGAVFGLTVFGGAGLIWLSWLWPSQSMGVLVVLAAGGLVGLCLPMLKVSLLVPADDPAYRAAQLRAHEHALRAMVAGAFGFILLSTAELAAPPLWLAMALILWLGAVVGTGWLWWHRGLSVQP